MKPIYSFVLLLPVLLLFSCSSTEKKTEDALSDSIPRTGNALNVDATKIISTEEPPEVFTTTTIENNDWLKEFIHDPFSGITLDSMPVLLESKSITAEFNNAENGNLLFDGSEITFNRSYGDAICSADIRSVHLPLSKGLILGMTKKDFQLMINFIPSAGMSEDHNEQYEYVQTEAEHTYTIRFGFVKNKLIRFFYKKDPCVIYD